MAAKHLATKDGPAETAAAIRKKALALGFDAIGFFEADTDEKRRRSLQHFLQQGHHGDMAWLGRDAPTRADPLTLWPEARGSIALAMNYAPGDAPLGNLGHGEIGNISVYARGDDYHALIKKRLKELAGFVATRFGGDVKVFVDTAPLMEKPLAEKGGLGWQGKHTNLVSTKFGSWLFLGEILTTLPLAPDKPESNRCGTCRACLDICPTHAFPKPYELDARRCISYLTIEHKGVIAREFRKAIGNRIYGCDDCLAVCPWNKFARQTKEAAFLPRADLIAPKLRELAALGEAGFRKGFAGTAIKRTGWPRFLRNLLIALGNSGDPENIPIVEGHLLNADARPRGMAVWALRQLAGEKPFADLRTHHLPRENDPDVQAEWNF